MRVQTLPINSIATDSRVQPRLSINKATVVEYAHEMKNNVLKVKNEVPHEPFPPVVVFEDNSGPATVYWLADGFHRVGAVEYLATTGESWPAEIACEVHAGDMDAAIFYATGSNGDHGLRRTNGDKNHAIDRLLEHPDIIRAQWTDGRIALYANVSTSNVRKRRILRDERLKLQPATRRLGADGKTYSVKATQTTPASQLEPPSVEVTVESGRAFVNGTEIAVVVSEPTPDQVARENGTYKPQAPYTPGVVRASEELLDYERAMRAIGTVGELSLDHVQEIVQLCQDHDMLNAMVEQGLIYLMALDNELQAARRVKA